MSSSDDDEDYDPEKDVNDESLSEEESEDDESHEKDDQGSKIAEKSQDPVVEKSRDDLWGDFLKDVNSGNKTEQKSQKVDEKPPPEPEILEFAGEEVKIEQKSVKRPLGLAGVVSEIVKKKKIGTFEKSKIDWESFKSEKKIDDELKQHNRGKGGFLDKQDFLQRVDLNQFEREKELRNMSRKKN